MILFPNIPILQRLPLPLSVKPRPRPSAHQPRRPTAAARIAAQFYPTPPEAVRALLSVEHFAGPSDARFQHDIWEPACGNGQISEALIAAGYRVHSTDLLDYGYGESGRDFLAEPKALAKHIVTNPPYGSGLADRFVRHALTLVRETGGSVAMLLNLASLAYAERSPRWRRTPPAAIYAIDDVVCWSEAIQGPVPRSFNQHRYCWVVWKPGHTGRPSFWWLSAADFRDAKLDNKTHTDIITTKEIAL